MIKQYVKLFDMEANTKSFDKDVIDHVVYKEIEFKLGARGLRSICEAIMVDAMFELPSEKKIKEFRIGIEYAKNKLSKSAINKLKVA